MTSIVDARDAIITKILAVWGVSPYSVTPLFWMNGPSPNVDTLTEFVAAEVRSTVSQQSTLGLNPITRVDGHIRFIFFQREGNGDRLVTQMAEYVCDNLAYIDLGGITLAAPRPEGFESHDGWLSVTWVVPYWHYK